MPVIAVNENSSKHPLGFKKDTTVLECTVCRQNAVYRLFFTEDEKENLQGQRFNAQRAIDAEHPRHSYEIQLW